MAAPPDSGPPPTAINADRAHLAITVPDGASPRAIEAARKAQQNLMSFSVIVNQLSRRNALRRKADADLPYRPAYASGETAWILNRACAPDAQFGAPAYANASTNRSLAQLPWALVATPADHEHIHHYLGDIASTWLNGDWRPRFTCARPVTDDENVLAALHRRGIPDDAIETVAEMLQASRRFAQRAVRDEDRTVRNGLPYSPWFTEYRITIVRPGRGSEVATIPTLSAPAAELTAWAQFGVRATLSRIDGKSLTGAGPTQRLIIALLRSRLLDSALRDASGQVALAGPQDDVLDRRADSRQQEIVRSFFEVALGDESSLLAASRVTKVAPGVVAEFLNDVKLHLCGRQLQIVRDR